jgi:hypothetical protein
VSHLSSEMYSITSTSLRSFSRSPNDAFAALYQGRKRDLEAKVVEPTIRLRSIQRFVFSDGLLFLLSRVEFN